MMLAMESSDCVVILDDALARKTAELLGIKVTGTLGVLLDAKRAGLIDDLTSVINHLEKLNFLSFPPYPKSSYPTGGRIIIPITPSHPFPFLPQVLKFFL